ncbi:cytochrome P450 6k1-like [Pogonomyrmex barbatus]|uniref:Cytochrome P450 6k1-like n=1 Tax=Pogonomyrmex barbatus TaxID=144034 RepID=A0A6I9WTK4_9HYME|nr:cytochrome P450 6k1-like [Pogonomyrmex barbatus]
MLVSLILVFTIVILFWVYTSYKLNYWKRRGVEFLPPHRIFGNFKDAVLFRSAPGWHIGDLHKMARSDAPFVGFYIFHKPCLLLRDPEIIKYFMIRDFDNFSDRHFAGSTQKDSIGMKNLFGLKNPAWKYLRTKITPTLTRGKLKQMLPLMLDTANPMMEYIKEQPINSDNVRVIDAQDLNYKFTTDLIASVALGTKIDSFHYPNYEFSAAVQEFFYGFKRMVALVTVFFMPELVEVIGTRMLFNSSFVGKIFWNAMENREKTGEKRGDFIDSLLQLKNSEQDPVYKFQIPNTDITIEKGTPIYISLYGLGVDPRFWDEPEVFNPDRFAENKNIPDAYMPFGSGPRMCVGMKVGQLHAKVVLALLLKDYEVWQTKEHTSFLDPRSTFTASGNGINLHFRKI